MFTEPIRLDSHTVRRLSVESMRDPRTVRAAYDGRASGLAAQSVRAAAIRLGIDPPPPQHAAP